jgi:hypothetical protein
MKIASQTPSAQVLIKRISLNSNLDFSQITETSLRGVGRSSQRLMDVFFHWWNHQPPKKGGGEAFILNPKN